MFERESSMQKELSTDLQQGTSSPISMPHREPLCHPLSELIERDQLKTWLREGKTLILIDVREKWERESYHIGGIHVSLSELVASSPSWPKEMPVICYCQSGRRSLIATHWLRVQGYTESYSLARGMIGWQSELNHSSSSRSE